jgi:hypothetical protein
MKIEKRTSSYCFFVVILMFVITVYSLGCAEINPKEKQVSEIKSVSIINLISNPEKYDGKTIRAIGYISVGLEHCILYMHSSDSEYNIINNAIWINSDDDLKKLGYKGDGYYLLEGVFNEGVSGHLGAYKGSLSKIQRIEQRISRTEYMRKSRL